MKRPNFHHLFIFHTVALHRSFSRAADALSISQPAVSIQVRELERSLGSPLLHRARKGPKLTDTGSTVFEYTHRIFGLAEEVQEVVHDVQGLRRGRLTVGSNSTPGEYILPWVIGQFQRRHPAVEVSISICNTQAIFERISNHEIDMGMVGAPVRLKGLASFPYVSDEIVVVAPSGHELARRGRVSLSDLREQRFIMGEPGSATRRMAEACLKRNNISVSVAMELGSNEAVKSAVAAGLGLAAVSKFSAAPDIAGGFLTALDVEGWSCEWPLAVFYRKDKHLPAAQKEFLRFLQDERPLPPSVDGVEGVPPGGRPAYSDSSRAGGRPSSSAVST